MKVKKFILSCLTVAAAFSVNAQEAEKTENVFVPHWYIQGQFGGQETLGEVSFGKLLSLNAQVSGGYNFNPVWGARFSVNAWKSKAGWYNTGDTWSWNYIAPMVDATANLSNLFCGYNPDRAFTFGAFAGMGLNIGFGNSAAQDVNTQLNASNVAAGYEYSPLSYLWDGCKARLAGRVGGTVDYRINNNWSVGAELQATILGDRYNSKRAGNPDWYFNALVGVKYTFGTTNKTRPVVVAVPVEQVVEEKVKALYEDKIADLEEQVKELADCCEEKTAAVEAAEAKTAAAMRRDVFFNISCNKISIEEMVKVKEVIAYMKGHPETTVKLTGYADKGTGNPTINALYAKNRAKTVAKVLVENGISESRIKVESKGDTEQPYEEAVLNRVCICIINE